MGNAPDARDPAAMLLTLDDEALARCAPTEISDALERGAIVFFPRCPIELPDEDALAALRERLPRLLGAKNVSYHPESDRVRGINEDEALRERARALLKAHSIRVQAFLQRVIPDLVEGWTVGTSSFRPIEERGRDLAPHASNELVHVDAGAYGATDGDRILRFFVNVNPDTDRVWGTKGAFPALYERYGEEAGIAGADVGRLERGPLDRLRTGVLRGLVGLGVKEAMLADSSPYDRLMRRFHNYMKDTPAFQQRRDDYEELRFPPYSAWTVLTDTVSHSSVSGQHALVDTFVVRLASCRLPEVAPINVLRAGGASRAGATA